MEWDDKQIKSVLARQKYPREVQGSHKEVSKYSESEECVKSGGYLNNSILRHIFSNFLFDC